MGYNSKYFENIFLMHTHKHTSDWDYELPIPSCLLLTVILYSATVWQQMDSSAFIKKKKRMENKNIYNIMEKQ